MIQKMLRIRISKKLYLIYIVPKIISKKHYILDYQFVPEPLRKKWVLKTMSLLRLFIVKR
jgi:hypothetical protein